MCIRDRVLMGANEGVLIVGATGTGKTQIVKGVMRQMALSGHFSTSVVQFSAQTTAANLQFNIEPVSYTHLRAHETPEHLVCRLLLEQKTVTTTSVRNTLDVRQRDHTQG
eukprot:TRINITY_DN46939_c0_g1_i1.p2 TRINITY_DN46939_c0_g1~~TRINITY_DN46939_c0_g1_i1.p2  ORF type:complete len:110 (-),score=14.76 TRINITY_DN46939_c0_g1_i1:15-344(-)